MDDCDSCDSSETIIAQPDIPPAPKDDDPALLPSLKRAPLPPLKSQGVIFGDLDPIPIDPNIDPPPYHCFNCWRRGHRFHDCQRPRSSILCHNCGRRGVKVKDCPRCSRGHLKHLNRCGRAATWVRNTEPEPATGDEFDGVSETLREAMDDLFRGRGTPFIADLALMMHTVKHLSAETRAKMLKQLIDESAETKERRTYWMEKLGEKF